MTAAEWLLGAVAALLIQFFLGALRRVVSMLGPDTFGRARLLGDAPGAYPELGPRSRRWLRSALRWSFPALVALAAGGAMAQPALLLPHVAFCGGLGLLALSEPERRGETLGIIGLVFGLAALVPQRVENG